MPTAVRCQETTLALEEFLPYRLAILAHKMSRELAGVYGEKFGLSIPAWRILANLGHWGPLYAGELAERSSLDKPQVTRALQRLEADGLVRRKIDSQDRRQVRLALTRRGRALLRQIAMLARGWEAAFLAPLAQDERKMLDRILTKLLRGKKDRAGRLPPRAWARARTARNAEAL
jgi:DNA-binding MarR family transcriptional regulator